MVTGRPSHNYVARVTLLKQLQTVDLNKTYTCGDCSFIISAPDTLCTFTFQELHAQPANFSFRRTIVITTNDGNAIHANKLFTYLKLIDFLIEHGITYIDTQPSLTTLECLVW